MTMKLGTPAMNTVLNIKDFHYEQYPDSEPVTVDRLASGDLCLTRSAPDGSVTYIDIIDQHNGEFVSTAHTFPVED